MQLLIPTSDGLIGVNVGVTVGGPVPTSVPAGLPPSIGRMPVILLLASILLLAVGPLRRWREVAGPA
jgi:hypothetical protein